MATQSDSDFLRVLPNAAAIAREGARLFARHAGATIARNGRFTVALAGGTTPTAMQQLLSEPEFKDTIDWSKVHVFWGDERLVPRDHPDSTFRVANATLLSRVPIPPDNVHAPVTVGLSPAQSAAQYSQSIAQHFGQDPPRFDLIFLGLGPDGHTASLFPQSPLVTSPTAELVCAVLDSPKPPPVRVTFTPHLINQAAHVVFMADGAGKAAAVRGVFDPGVTPAEIPAKIVHPIRGTLTWLLDTAAYGDTTL